MFVSGRSIIAVLVLLLVSLAAFGSVGSSAPQPKLRWKQNKIRLAVSSSLISANPNLKPDSDVVGAVRRSIAAWQSVTDVEFVFDTSPRESVSPAGASGDGVSLITIAATTENVLMFGKDDGDAAAKTRVFFNRRGYITEADIVLSPFQQFSTDGSYGTFDLESTLKHEIGHLLGLRHSPVVGSLMYSVAAKNGVFGENGLFSGVITDDDAAAVRGLYDETDYDGCCGSVNGRLTGIGKNTQSIDLWVQDKYTGRVTGHGTASRDGSFHIGGLEAGTHDVMVRENGRSLDVSSFRLGQVVIEKGESVWLSRKLVRQPRDFSLGYLGKNGVLADSPLWLQRGNEYTVYLGGRNLSPGRVRIEIDSDLFTIDQSSLAPQAFGNDLSGLSFIVKVDADAPNGTYSVCALSENGSRDCIVGGIAIFD